VAVLVVTAVMQKLLAGTATWLYVVVNLGVNGIILWITLSLARRFMRVERKVVAEPRPYARPPAQPAPAPAAENPATSQPPASSPAH